MSGETKASACGRWRELLPALGIAQKYLVNRHGPCPLCGGRDRFRYDDRNRHGDYYCNQCGAGDGITLLRKKHGWSYAEVCCEIDRVLGTAHRPPEKQHSHQQ